jgi:hypothetical protein
MVLSVEPDMTRRVAGENRTDLTMPVWPSKFFSAPFSRSIILIVQSPAPKTSSDPHAIIAIAFNWR